MPNDDFLPSNDDVVARTRDDGVSVLSLYEFSAYRVGEVNLGGWGETILTERRIEDNMVVLDTHTPDNRRLVVATPASWSLSGWIPMVYLDLSI